MKSFNEVITGLAKEAATKYGLGIEDTLPFYDKFEASDNGGLTVRHKPYTSDSLQVIIYKNVFYQPVNGKCVYTERWVNFNEELKRVVTKLETKQRSEKDFFIEAIKVLQES